jgi:hypothetical protein
MISILNMGVRVMLYSDRSGNTQMLDSSSKRHNWQIVVVSLMT